MGTSADDASNRLAANDFSVFHLRSADEITIRANQNFYCPRSLREAIVSIELHVKDGNIVGYGPITVRENLP